MGGRGKIGGGEGATCSEGEEEGSNSSNLLDRLGRSSESSWCTEGSQMTEEEEEGWGEGCGRTLE